MTHLVVHGMLLDKLGMCQQRSTAVHGDRWPQTVEHRTESFAIPPSSFREQQDAVRLNLEHDRRNPIGRLVALEEGSDGGLWATFVSTETELLRSVSRPWYLSAEVAWKGSATRAHDAELRSVALVRNPAATCTKPVTILVGDLSNTYARSRWRLQGAEGERLERAAEQLKWRRPDDPVTLRNHTAEMQQLLHRSRGMSDYEMAMVLGQQHERRRSRIEHGPSGRIISVR